MSAATPAQELDLKLERGTVFDGLGGRPRVIDVGVRGDRIVALGDLRHRASARTIDARTLAVAPGFIDVHAHADAIALRRSRADNFVAMGVTTIVTGNCGGSVRNLRTHFRALERGGIGVNYASLVGHGTVRRQVMGTAARAPNDAELASMKRLVEREMRAGAVGLSTGLIYVPGTYSDTEELVALAAVAGRHGGVYASHMRDEAARVLAAIDEALEIGRRAGVHVHLSHLKASGKPHWGRSAEIVERLRGARAAGARVTGDQYAYTASSTSLDVLFPSRELAIGRKEFAHKLRDDAAFRERMRAALQSTIDASGFGDLSYCQIANAPNHRELNGLRISQAASRALDSTAVDRQIEMAIRLMVAADGARVSMVYHQMTEPDVERIMREPYVAVAADAGIRATGTDEKPHPRGSGNNPRVLARYVRERGVVPLELAVLKMTSLPAAVFGLENRGTIRLGAFADLTVFDPDAVADHATYSDPLSPPGGIPFVIVNGEFVIDSGNPTGSRPGRVLRGPGATTAESEPK